MDSSERREDLDLLDEPEKSEDDDLLKIAAAISLDEWEKPEGHDLLEGDLVAATVSMKLQIDIDLYGNTENRPL